MLEEGKTVHTSQETTVDRQNKRIMERKVKVNLSLCLTKYHAMKTYVGMEV
jgi:hypothetical protein